MSQFSLTHVWPLWLLAAAPLIWLLGWRHRTSLTVRRMSLATALRSVAVALLVLALTEPVLHKSLHDVSVVYALDISRSVSPAFIDAALESVRAANLEGRPAQARYVAFADQAKLLESIDALRKVAVTQENTLASSDNVISKSTTNLQHALEVSLFGFAPNYPKRLVLLTDGNQTEGDVWRVLPQLLAQHVRIFAVPASVAVGHDARVEALEVPEGVRQQEPAAVKVQVFSLSEAKARVDLTVGNEFVGTQTVTLGRGGNALIFSTQFKQSGANNVEVRVAADGDQVPENDVHTDTVWVGPRPKVLYVEGTPESAHFLRDRLRRQGIDVSISSVEKFSGKLAGQDAVILSDVSAKKIDGVTERRLEAFVREGGGLLFAAGENTYGDAGFAKSAVERLLPVEFEGERKRKELDLVLLIDRSFSMGGQKLEFAKSAALATLDLFDERHRLAIVSFDATLEDVLPLHEVGNKRRAEDLIGGMFAAGQTNIFNALWYAHRLLEDSPAKTKHIILLSDGQTGKPGEMAPEVVSSSAMQMLRQLRERRPAQEPLTSDKDAQDAAAIDEGVLDVTALLAAAGITLSTVTIGEEPNLEVMTSLAKGTNGKSYVAQSDAEIPSLFVAETKRLMGESIVEKPFRPLVKVRTGALAGLDFASGPELKGFVISKPKQFTEVLLEAKDQHPLLVQTHYGLGKSVAFLSDVKNRWAADWLKWPGYGKLWAQMVRGSIRRDTGEELALRVTRAGREAVVTLTAVTVDGKFRNDIAPKVRITEPGENSFVKLLRQLGPGKYQARIPLRSAHPAPHRFELVEGPGVTQQDIARAGTRSLSYAYPDEYRVLPPNLALLRALSEQTSGNFAPKTEEIFANHGDGGRVSRALWQFLAAAALLVFLLEILVRRLPLGALSNSPRVGEG